MSTTISHTALRPVVGGALEVPLVTGGSARYRNLDYAASAPALEVVAAHVVELLPLYASVHRGAGYASQVSTSAYEHARVVVGEFVGARPKDAVLFTRNTTDSLNLLASIVPGETVLLDIEHHANLLPWQARGARVIRSAQTVAETLVAIDAELARRPAALLTVTGASNVTGEVLPLRAIASIAHRYGTRLAVDGAQLVPHRRVSLAAQGIDYLAFSGHKTYAPFGAGVLVGRADWFDAGDPYLLGGGAVTRVALDDETQWRSGPSRHEAGSPNVLGVAALARAVQALAELDEDEWVGHETRLRERLVDGLEALGATTYRIFPDSADAVGVVSFSLDGVDSRLFATYLSAEWGIGVRDGKFCAHPLLSKLGVAGAALRASVGLGSSEADVDVLLEATRSFLQNGPAWRYELVDGQWTVPGDTRPRPDWAPELSGSDGFYGCVA